VCLGTRPEAIKLAPVIRALAASRDFQPIVLLTAQHRELTDQVMRVFELDADIDLDLMRPGQSLTDVTTGVLQGVGRVIEEERPAMLIAQGDTTTVFASALAAFYHQVPIGHVEAGLRSGRLDDPFPEEANRLLSSRLTTLHFAPTERAHRTLVAEGINQDRVTVTGNTVVDALHMVLSSGSVPALPSRWDIPPAARALLVTLHRRESWGAPLAGICDAFLNVLEQQPDVWLFFPVHPQPKVREQIFPKLGQHPRVRLVDPLDYLEFMSAMRACHFIVTDSGGVQEEAPVLAKPVLVLRRVTERVEAIEAGTARLIGTEREAVERGILELLRDGHTYRQMAQAKSPFGDGHASERIVTAMSEFFAR
jgi:UDP-N-acetylglucosamine 2-epimerase (non-hydrolysing)